MIIYNHVVNQCEDQKLILSQIFNTPIYMLNYSCIEFLDIKSRGVGRVKQGSCLVGVIRGHFQLITQIFCVKIFMQYYRVSWSRGHLGSEWSNWGRTELRSFEVILNLYRWNLYAKSFITVKHNRISRSVDVRTEKVKLGRIDLRSFGVNVKNNLSSSIFLRFSIRR